MLVLRGEAQHHAFINQASTTSLTSAAEHGKHADALAAMGAKMEQLREELKTKDRLV